MDAKTHNENQMLRIIIEEKTRRGLSEEEWIKYLGISWGSWSRFKNRQRPLTNNFLAIVAAKCPDIQLSIFQYMRLKGGDRSGK